MTQGTGKRRWQRVDGVLLLDKSSGMTSNDALQKARRLFSAEKGGHTGTLDPLATGLLPLCFGEATKFSADLLEADKTYVATLRLGVTTTTGDAQGEVLQERPVTVSREQFSAAMSGFLGEIEQVPPMYSALKRDGVPLYRLARQGISVERAARQVVIHQLSLISFAATEAVIAVTCSKGTYIRTLAEDIGEQLGCGAHLTALRRTAVGPLKLQEGATYTLEQLAARDESELPQVLLPVDALLASLPVVELSAQQQERFCCGNPVPENTTGLCRVYHAHCLLGVGEGDGQWLKPKRLLRQAPSEAATRPGE